MSTHYTGIIMSATFPPPGMSLQLICAIVKLRAGKYQGKMKDDGQVKVR